MSTVAEEAKWYVVHTYSGYENKVKANIEKLVGNRGMQDQIFEVAVPLEDCVEDKNGKQVVVQRKVFPGYVLVNMIMNDNTWYVVRNTRGVTGFVGPGSKPVALSEEEVNKLGIQLQKSKIDVELGETVQVIDGPFEGSVGNVTEILEPTETVIVTLSIFGRETPVELSSTQIKKI
ncbi:MAG: transcription termination/antitermination protein NusG [Clostridia bacterium]|uniref:Transcription termination/antitermination protein NusG n=1 Tax=Bianquea renquensis TaxID=2763661 RepID=A0A926DTT2_9FIRM|nr:transcription termination/antitermination protein NusG [Bianquea renquensis]MBC8543239.1 transcription termination/antitermination protein NusG [Bianquea renquensis]